MLVLHIYETEASSESLLKEGEDGFVSADSPSDVISLFMEWAFKFSLEIVVFICPYFIYFLPLGFAWSYLFKFLPGMVLLAIH